MDLKKVRIMLGFALLFLFSFSLLAPVANASLQPSDQQTVMAKPGDNNATVKEIKSMLKEQGYLYFYGNTNGYYSRATKIAVYLFQRANRLPATGIVDSLTYQVLKDKCTSAEPQPEPQPTPDPEPQPTPEPTPEPQPEPQPTPEPTPEPQPEPQPTPEPTPEPQPEPQPTPEPTPEPQPEPQPIPEPTPEPQPEPQPAPDVAGLSADEQQMLNLINEERAKAGVAPLQADMRLVQSARKKSQDMIDNNYFSHTSPTLGSFAELIRSTTGGDYGYIGENLAGAPSVEIAHKNLMNSEGHRKNILNPNYTHIGIGVIDGGPYGKMFTQHFGGLIK